MRLAFLIMRSDINLHVRQFMNDSSFPNKLSPSSDELRFP